MANMTAAARPIPESPPVTIVFFPVIYRYFVSTDITVVPDIQETSRPRIKKEEEPTLPAAL